MIISEYYRFLEFLKYEGASSDVCRFANIVGNHIESIIPLTTARGQRAKKLVQIVGEKWETTTSNIELSNVHTDHKRRSIKRLKSLSVGPFRGFAKPEEFDLDDQIVLAYGPNGTGKSSFCESLEYCLLGSVSEAEMKRFKKLDDYLRNAYTNSYSIPRLYGIDNDNNEIEITPNEEFFRFCFIEKNRIDNFSRIAAQLPSKQSELISILFGLDKFNEFVNNFTESLEKYIDLVGVKSIELLDKKSTLIGYQQQLDIILPMELAEIKQEEYTLANTYKNGYTFADMDIELHGDNSQKGLITAREEELQQQIPLRYNLTYSEFTNLRSLISQCITKIMFQKDELLKDTESVSFKRLYEAIMLLGVSNPEKCPACHTPLSKVISNPFLLADAELKNLEALGKLQQNVKELEKELNTYLKRVLQFVTVCCSKFTNEKLVFLLINEEDVSLEWWYSLHKKTSEMLTAWEEIGVLVKKLEGMDKINNEMSRTRSDKQSELISLNKLSRKINSLKVRRESINIRTKQAKDTISSFYEINEKLISEVETEKEIVRKNKLFVETYHDFVSKLNKYNEGLPLELIKDLGKIVVQLYNSFNRGDSESEKIAEIRLPIQQNQKLEISFANHPNKFYDALHILSEGHIRCIGLAILLAKNLKEECPLVIFDDPVNAIDDDHREAIRKTMFKDGVFQSKQIILACHGEEFFKDIQNILPLEQAKKIKSVSFLPKNDYNINVDHNCAPRNYIISSRTHLEKNEKRDALDKSRKALESLTKNKLWSYVGKYGDANISLKLRSAKAPIELRNLTEQLNSKINKNDFADQNKEVVLGPIKLLLGINGESTEWRYLNKGTHEEADRAEFDRNTILYIIDALEQLDKALTESSRAK